MIWDRQPQKKRGWQSVEAAPAKFPGLAPQHPGIRRCDPRTSGYYDFFLRLDLLGAADFDFTVAVAPALDRDLA